ncbi:hypothetical protein BD626DRAFT_144968 [Schizophyllum amplum]|uniref:Uncharacterized protein n=1 Tax=Schizophyllum amplum TaxID=97359 RepID=A0A550C4Y6_9AGAR|nr:hypothetical protein BD626DRAFT_144968 [Auriculariopsis ampla]
MGKRQADDRKGKFIFQLQVYRGYGQIKFTPCWRRVYQAAQYCALQRHSGASARCACYLLAPLLFDRVLMWQIFRTVRLGRSDCPSYAMSSQQTYTSPSNTALASHSQANFRAPNFIKLVYVSMFTVYWGSRAYVTEARSTSGALAPLIWHGVVPSSL